MATNVSSKTKHIMFVVASYWVVSISMVFLNKFLMSSEDMSIPAPLFITWFQCVVSTFITWLCGQWGEEVRAKGQSGSFFHQFKKMSISTSTLLKVSIEMS